ncbi:MAG: hypothetical protein JWL65_5724 [Gammaproteobacteria bacterium]|nr:hypothetical protein [Gammaproteobacteria bacterium]
MSDLEGSKGAPALCVHASLRDDLTSKMRQLFEQPDILQQGRPARPCSQDGLGKLGEDRGILLGLPTALRRFAHFRLQAATEEMPAIDEFECPQPTGRDSCCWHRRGRTDPQRGWGGRYRNCRGSLPRGLFSLRLIAAACPTSGSAGAAADNPMNGKSESHAS